MKVSCGIIGLPNVGKSTLFNALTGDVAAAENFPFCTIEPNTGMAPVADSRLDDIARIAGSARTVPATVRFIDVAGLVRGAAGGEGLGNRFLGHIREATAIVHVLRCFTDDRIVHVDARVDPSEDLETVHLELVLADLEMLARAIEAKQRQARDGSRDRKLELEQLERFKAPLEAGVPLRSAGLTEEEAELADQLRMITIKPMLYLANIDELSDRAEDAKAAHGVRELADRDGAGFLACCNRLEAELAQLDSEDRAEMLEELGMAEPALARLTQEAYRMLGLMTFFTAGPKEARAWPIRRGSLAPQAAGTIHSDMERGFIRAETISCEQYIRLGGEAQARQAGQMRQEGRDYVVQDGDVCLFRFNV